MKTREQRLAAVTYDTKFGIDSDPLTDKDMEELRVLIDKTTERAEDIEPNGDWDEVALLTRLYENLTGYPVER